jgi:hypothetical protein
MVIFYNPFVASVLLGTERIFPGNPEEVLEKKQNKRTKTQKSFVS